MRVWTRRLSARAAIVAVASLLVPASADAADRAVLPLKLTLGDRSAAGAAGLHTGDFTDAARQKGTVVGKLRWSRGDRRLTGVVLASYDAAGQGRLCVDLQASGRKGSGRGSFAVLGGTGPLATTRGTGRVRLKTRAGVMSASLSGIAAKGRRRGLPASCRRLLRLPASTERTAFVPVADAYGSAGAPRTRFGSAAALRVSETPESTAHLRFQLRGLSGPVRSASLRLFATRSSTVGFLVHRVTDNGWRERTLTFAGAPRPGPQVAASGPLMTGWSTTDVTPLVAGDGTVTIALTAPAGASDLSSREARLFAPQLVVETGRGDGPPAGSPPPSEPGPTRASADTSAPRVTLSQPAHGTVTSDATPTFAGTAGDDEGDAASVNVRLYAGSSASGLPAQTLTAVRDGTAWSVEPPAALAPGTYTARAEQGDAAGNTGVSDAATFTIERPAAPDPKIAAVGDIACAPTHPSFNGGAGTSTECRQRSTSEMVASSDYDAVLALGDLQYELGEYEYFQQVFHPTWGRAKNVMRPVAGNHEYGTTGAAGYFDYFNGVGSLSGPVGDRGKGYYSFDLDNWHLVALNSNCAEVGGCHAGSEQEKWLRDDLEANPRSCILAYWHHPLFNSGNNGPTNQVAPLWTALDEARADLVLVGHAHSYERFARQAPDGSADPQNGIRQITAGMGGKTHHDFGTVVPNSGIRENETYGILELTLGDDGYEWRFVPEAGTTFSESGSDSCTGPTIDSEAPSVPTGLSGAADPGGVRLTWTASTDNDGVAGYRVLRDGVEVGTTRTASFTDTTVQPNTGYSYRVIARDAVGNASAQTAPVLVTSGSTNELRFTPVADAFIDQTTPTTNYGSASILQVDNDPKQDFLARFTVSGVGARPVASAKLRLWVTDGSAGSGGTFAPVADNDWGEGTITWSTAPAAYPPAFTTLGAVSGGQWVEIDVSSYVTGDGTYSFRASSASNDGADYASREGGSGQAPQLIVVHGG